MHRGERDDLRGKVEAQRNVLTAISVSPCGGSAARNVGIRWLSSSAHPESWVGFPDDDCVLVDGTLETVESLLPKSRLRFLLGQYGPSLSEIDGDVYPTRPLPAARLPFPHQRLVSGSTMYCRLGDLVKIGGYIDEIGVGAIWDAGEENDLVTRLLLAGARGVYLPQVRALHPYRQRSYLKSQAPWIGLNSAYASVSLRFVPTAVRSWLGLLGRVVTRRQSARDSLALARESVNPAALQVVKDRFMQARTVGRR